MTPSPQPDALAVCAQGLVKRYGGAQGVTALDGVDITVRRGTVLGVLGPNGAGKTTLIRILSTLIRPDGGSARVGGHDVVNESRRVRRLIGLTGQYAAVDAKLSGRENLYLIGRLLDLSRKGARARADELLERFSLTGAADRLAGTYSGGMRRRLDLAASVLGSPEVLFLDEPTTGLDPRTRNEVWHEVRSLAAAGTSVLLTTQYMEEAERLAHELTVIDRGRVIAEGPVAQLKARVGGRALHIRPAEAADLPRMAAVLGEAGVVVAERPERSGEEETEAVLRVPVTDNTQLTGCIGLLSSHGFELASVDTRVPSLDEVFLTLTGRPAPPEDHEDGGEGAGRDAQDVREVLTA